MIASTLHPRIAPSPRLLRVRQWIVLATLCLLASLVTGCAPRPTSATPEGAVREFIDRMRIVGTDPTAAKAVFGVLSKRTRQNLAERAQRYSAASGKTIAPEAMIVPSRFTLRFEPQRMTSTVVGSHALVEVIGLNAEERAKLTCTFEDDGWRVELELPPLPAVQVRPGSSP